MIDPRRVVPKGALACAATISIHKHLFDLWVFHLSISSSPALKDFPFALAALFRPLLCDYLDFWQA
jgi:hypothetical protein